MPPCVLPPRRMLLHSCAQRAWVRGSLPIGAEGDGQMAGEKRGAIVTGAASGIGRAITLGLLEGGIDVAAVDKETAWLDELKGAARGKGFAGAMETIRADLTDPASFEAIVSTVLGVSGRIDILV